MGQLLGIWDESAFARVPAVATPFLWPLIGIGLGLYFFFRGFALLRRKWSIENVPTSTVRGAPLGMVELKGKASGPYTIVAPLSGHDCFYFRTVVWKAGERAFRSKLAEERLATPFFLDDGTGKVMVDARGARDEFPPVCSEEYVESVPDYAKHFLSRHGITLEFPILVEEFVVHPGDSLFATGCMRELTLGPGGQAVDRPEYLSAAAADLQSMQELGGVLAGVPGQRAAGKPTPSVEFDLNPHVILGSNAPRQPLFLSLRSEREIVQSLAWHSNLCLWGGPALTLSCLWYVLNRLQRF